MFVNIKYYKGNLEGYHGGKYTYRTKLPLKVGDKVIAPTLKEPTQRGIVVEVNVAEPYFDCREITEYDPTEFQNGAKSFFGEG